MTQENTMSLGIVALLCILLLLILSPLIFMDMMLLALYKLGIPPLIGLVIIMGIIIGSFINIPIKRYPVNPVRDLNLTRLHNLNIWLPEKFVNKSEMVIAINVGGCLIPMALVLYQLIRLLNDGNILLPGFAIMLNIMICYRISLIMPGIGILMPAFFPGIVAALSGLLLYPENPPTVAFCAGVLGPLIGADLLHLKEIIQMRAGTSSIGGAGTFDGIVISGFVALLLS